jgi:hypothetical protein
MTVFIWDLSCETWRDSMVRPAGVVNRQTAVIAEQCVAKMGGIRTQFSAQVRPGPGPVTS